MESNKLRLEAKVSNLKDKLGSANQLLLQRQFSGASSALIDPAAQVDEEETTAARQFIATVAGLVTLPLGGDAWEDLQKAADALNEQLESVNRELEVTPAPTPAPAPAPTPVPVPGLESSSVMPKIESLRAQRSANTPKKK